MALPIQEQVQKKQYPFSLVNIYSCRRRLIYDLRKHSMAPSHIFQTFQICARLCTCSGEPNNLVGDEDCIVVQTENSWKVNTTSWRDYPCCQNQKIPAVLCQMPGTFQVQGQSSQKRAYQIPTHWQVAWQHWFPHVLNTSNDVQAKTVFGAG